MSFLNFDFDEEERRILNTIPYKKKMGDFLSQARKQSKLNKCFYCSKPTTRFCNSHFVPAFCLRNIAIDGEVNYANTLFKLPAQKNEKGVNEAGTFRIICPECDSTIFSEYENSEKYIKKPSSKMLAQITLKNYLKNISKRFMENAMYEMASNISLVGQQIEGGMSNVNSLDLVDYRKGFEKAKRFAKKADNDNYYLFYHEILNYVVPVAFQGGVALIADLEGNVVNDIYCMSSDYHIKDLHICVFPLQDKSIVMMFIDSEDKRYRSFCKQFRKLSKDKKLAITNYIIFLYSEDVFFSKSVPQNISDKLINTAKTTSTGFSPIPINDPLQEAVEKFNLTNNWTTIPNLLEEKYKLR